MFLPSLPPLHPPPHIVVVNIHPDLTNMGEPTPYTRSLLDA